jgi:hypothetical protein
MIVAWRKIAAASARICSLREGIAEGRRLAASARRFCSLRPGIAVYKSGLKEKILKLLLLRHCMQRR